MTPLKMEARKSSGRSLKTWSEYAPTKTGRSLRGSSPQKGGENGDGDSVLARRRNLEALDNIEELRHAVKVFGV